MTVSPLHCKDCFVSEQVARLSLSKEYTNAMEVLEAFQHKMLSAEDAEILIGSMNPSESKDSTYLDILSMAERLNLAKDIGCVYVQILENAVNKREMLQKIDALKDSNSDLLPCVFFAQHNALMSLSYFADAYLESKSYVRKYPNELVAHLAMGEALLKLDRRAEAKGAILAANYLFSSLLSNAASQSNPNQSALKHFAVNENVASRLGFALLQIEEKQKAHHVFTYAISVIEPNRMSNNCDLLAAHGRLQVELTDLEIGYVSMLQCLRYCPHSLECELYLGNELNPTIFVAASFVGLNYP